MIAAMGCIWDTQVINQICWISYYLSPLLLLLHHHSPELAGLSANVNRDIKIGTFYITVIPSPLTSHPTFDIRLHTSAPPGRASATFVFTHAKNRYFISYIFTSSNQRVMWFFDPIQIEEFRDQSLMKAASTQTQESFDQISRILSVSNS